MVNTKGNISYTISEITNDLKTDKRFIRFCEEKDLISPKITTFNRRIYSEYDRARLELILHCEASDYALDQVIDLIGTPDPGQNKIEQFRNGLEYGEKRLDELIKQSEEISFHQRTNIMTDVNLMKQYVKNLQAIKATFLDEFEEKPKRLEEEKIDLEPKAAVKPIEKTTPAKEEKPTRQPARMVPIFAVGFVLILVIAGYVYYQNTTKKMGTSDLAQNQIVETKESKELLEKAPEEIKELPEKASDEFQKETKIVLSKAYPDEQEAPAPQPEATTLEADQKEPVPQEQPEPAAETPQPAPVPAAQPDTGEKTQDQAPEPETKAPVVAAVTQDQPSPPAVAEPPPAEATTPQPEAKQAEATTPEADQKEPVPQEQPEPAAETATPEPVADQNTLAAVSTEDATKPENPENRIKAFLAYYCNIYESKDMDKFFSLFTADATENNTPFNELKPKYQKNMEIIEAFQYHIDMTDYSSIPETGNTLVQGTFSIKYRLQGKSWKEHSGNVTMELTQKGDSYLVKRLNYGS